jgi:DNA-binding response OmpR family regulator
MNRIVPRVLIVEDDDYPLELLATIFERWHFEVWPAATLARALEQLSPHVDLVILDLKLPGGSGLEVLREIRARGYTCPVMVTSGEDLLRVEGLADLNPEYALQKPICAKVLYSVARKVLDNFRPTSDPNTAHD